MNVSDFVTKMGDLGGTEFVGDTIKTYGSEFNEWYGYRADGIFQTQEEVDKAPKLNAQHKARRHPLPGHQRPRRRA